MKKILVVEDVEFNRELVVQLLKTTTRSSRRPTVPKVSDSPNASAPT